MKYCKKCGSESKVQESRPNVDGYMVRLRRCKECNFRWQTIEVDYWDYVNLLKKGKEHGIL